MLWISNAPDSRSDRAESAKEACAAALQGCLHFMQSYDLAIWCAVATSARLELSSVTLDEVLDPVSWDYRRSTGVSLYGYCLSLSRHRSDLWASEWAAASTLWEELLQFAQSISADLEVRIAT